MQYQYQLLLKHLKKNEAIMSEEKKVMGYFDAEDDATMNFLEKKQRNSDGIYRPSLNDAVDKREGYKATIRFLKNLKKDGTLGESAVEKHMHYVKLFNHKDLMGYYDCKKNTDTNCPLCDTYWELFNSKNAADQEKAKLLKRSTKYYSYVQIIEDENNRDLEGKIMVFSYGFKLREKIKAQWKGEVDGKKCNVFDPASGKDFRLIIKETSTPDGLQPNYDTSQFLQQEALKFKGKPIPTTYSEEHKKPIVTDPKIQKFLQDLLLKRDHDVEEYMAKGWEDATIDKVNKIIAIVNGEASFTSSAKNSIDGAAKIDSTSKKSVVDDNFSFGADEKETESVDDFFNVDDK